MIEVRDRSTGKSYFYGLPAREAIVAAHAQVVKKDYHTWDYPTKYAGLAITRDGDTLVCGTLHARESEH